RRRRHRHRLDTAPHRAMANLDHRRSRAHRARLHRRRPGRRRPAAQPDVSHPRRSPAMTVTAPPTGVTAAPIEARSVSAWFGQRKVLDQVSLTMPAGSVPALIGPSGCGKSTFLRILNRMHELVPSATLAGEVLLAGSDVYDPTWRLTRVRRTIGMVFQKPNPFPAMSIYDNVI